MDKITALVPMRHHSQRIPGKNFRQFAGKPLYYHIIERLLLVREITDVVVNTDSEIIITGLQKDFPQVKIIKRPDHLCADTVSMNEILLYDTAFYHADYFLQTHSTNPLLKPETITRAILTFLEQTPKYDSLFSVTRLHTRLYDRYGRALNHDPNHLIQTQDLPPVFEENSCIYIFTRDVLAYRQNRIGKDPLMFEINPLEGWDIDDEHDFTIAEYLQKIN